MPSGVPVTILPLTGHVTLGNLCKLSSLGFLICKMEEIILFYVVSVGTIAFWRFHFAKMSQGWWLVLALAGTQLGPLGRGPPRGLSMLLGLLASWWLDSKSTKVARPS